MPSVHFRTPSVCTRARDSRGASTSSRRVCATKEKDSSIARLGWETVFAPDASRSKPRVFLFLEATGGSLILGPHQFPVNARRRSPEEAGNQMARDRARLLLIRSSPDLRASSVLARHRSPVAPTSEIRRRRGTCENDAARQRAARSIQEAGGVRFRVGPPSAVPTSPPRWSSAALTPPRGTRRVWLVAWTRYPPFRGLHEEM